MRVHITEEAVFVLEVTEEDRVQLQHALRGTGYTSLIIPRRPTVVPPLAEDEQLKALIQSLRDSAQDTLAALRRRGYRIERDPGSG
jgi:hypothetical protein